MLCISNSFWVLAATKSWLKHFFQPFFKLFCSFQSFFSDFTAEINKKWTKKHDFVYSSKLVDMQKLVDSLRGYLKFVFFRLYFCFEMNKKGWQTAEKKDSTSFWVLQAPKSWWKYTTIVEKYNYFNFHMLHQKFVISIKITNLKQK